LVSCALVMVSVALVAPEMPPLLGSAL